MRIRPNDNNHYTVINRRRSSGLRSYLRQTITVTDNQLAVLVVDGRFDRVLPTGRHRIRPRRNSVHRLPALEQHHYVPGQEMLTADGASVRATVVAAVTITDPLVVLRGLGEQWVDQVHLEVQLALRAVIADLELEQLLDQRSTLDNALTPLLQSWAVERGLAVSRVVLRDLVVPGALKQAVANVVAAQLEGRAALERARGETAALRSLANAARALDNNPALLQLRLLQQIEASTGHTFVVGGALPSVT